MLYFLPVWWVCQGPRGSEIALGGGGGRGAGRWRRRCNFISGVHKHTNTETHRRTPKPTAGISTWKDETHRHTRYEWFMSRVAESLAPQDSSWKRWPESWENTSTPHPPSLLSPKHRTKNKITGMKWADELRRTTSVCSESRSPVKCQKIKLYVALFTHAGLNNKKKHKSTWPKKTESREKWC